MEAYKMLPHMAADLAADLIAVFFQYVSVEWTFGSWTLRNHIINEVSNEQIYNRLLQIVQGMKW